MANVEVLVKQWLDTVVTGWPISADKPKVQPVKFITIDRTGGPREAMVLDRAEILIEVFHKDSRLEASEKANEIADLIPYLKDFNENITRSAVNSLINLDDTLTQYHQYQLYCDVYLRR